MSGVFAKMSTSRLGVFRVAIIIAVVEGAMYSVAFALWHEAENVTLGEGIFAAASCITGITGYLCYFESIMDGQVSIAGTISAAYPALTVVGAVLLLSEELSLAQIFGVVAIIGGVIVLSYERNPGRSGGLSKRSLFFSLAAFLTWGVWSLSSKMAVGMVGAGNLFGFYIISSLTAPLIYAWFRKIRPATIKGSDPSKRAWTLAVIALALNVLGAYAYTYALSDGPASLVMPISSAYPIVTIVFAVGLLKEKIHLVQALALSVVIAGLVMIAVTL
jgi:drug/metabolite transporter (DMT)-like permease